MELLAALREPPATFLAVALDDAFPDLALDAEVLLFALVLEVPVLLPEIAFGRALLLGLDVDVAIFCSFICEDLAMPVLLPRALPDLVAVRVLDASARPLFPRRLAVFDFRTASLAPAADFTFPPPVITAEGFLCPPRALDVLLIGFLPGLTITASVFVFREVAAFRFVAAFVPAIGLTS